MQTDPAPAPRQVLPRGAVKVTAASADAGAVDVTALVEGVAAVTAMLAAVAGLIKVWVELRSVRRHDDQDTTTTRGAAALPTPRRPAGQDHLPMVPPGRGN